MKYSKYLKNKPSKPKNFDLDEITSFSPEQHVGHFVYTHTESYTHNRFFLDKEIVDPSEYRDLIQTLITATENDLVEILISSPGGSIEGMVAIISAMQECSCTVRVVIVGSCHSAASLIALSADEVAVMPYAQMLLHSASYGTGGKSAEVFAQVKHVEKYVSGIMRNVYKGFLTEKEIEGILSGTDLWLCANEIEERLEKRKQVIEKEQKKVISEIKKLQKKAEKPLEISQEVVDKVKKD